MDKNNNEKLKKVLRESLNDEFKDISDEPPFEPSKEFKKDMKVLIREENHPYLKMCKTKKGKTFIVLVAILIFALSSLSVGAVRETVARVIKAIPSIIMPEKKEKPKKPKNKKKEAYPVVIKKEKPKITYPLATNDEAVREEDASSSTVPTDGTVYESTTTTYENVIMPSTALAQNEVTEAPPASQ